MSTPDDTEDSVVRSHPWVSGAISDQPFLIIAGTYRSGTTALFTYLAEHPEISPAKFKEPAFFFSHRWNDTPPLYPPGHESRTYLSDFKKRRGAAVFMEATPNYLHDPGCAWRIADALPAAKILIVLRDPVDRLVSWYRHSLFQGRLLPDTSFETWIRDQLADERPIEDRPYMQRALAHGCYSKYVAEFLDVFGAERVHVAWFDDLSARPRELMMSVCRFAGIDPSYFDTYEFVPVNESMVLTHPLRYDVYIRLCRWIIRQFRGAPRVQFRVQKVVFSAQPAYLRLLSRPADPIAIPDELVTELRALYRADAAALRALLGRPVPWEGAYGV